MHLSPTTSATCRSALRSRLRQRNSSIRTFFHSHHHPACSDPFRAAEESILCAAYRYVPTHGFSHPALNLGARDAGYLDISPSVLSEGVFSLIKFHLAQQRRALAQTRHEQLDSSQGDVETDGGVSSRVAAITWARLKANKDIIHQWQDALAIMAQPSYIAASVKELALLSDEIWYLAGDKSVDSSWYSKRASLSMIYSASELFMTNDKSVGFADTKEFMVRRIDNATSLGGAVSNIGTWLDFTITAGMNVMRSKGVGI